MPQLDKFTYFTQFFWSCLFLFTFYIPICNDGDGVLGISRILKLRNKLKLGLSVLLGTFTAAMVEEKVIRCALQLGRWFQKASELHPDLIFFFILIFVFVSWIVLRFIQNLFYQKRGRLFVLFFLLLVFFF